MARKALGPAALEVSQAVAAMWPGGEVVVGVSGGADSMALVLGAQWCAERDGGSVRAVIVDHQLQEGSGAVAERVREMLEARGVRAEVRAVEVADSPDGVEAAAREARLGALASDGLPVMLGHTLDDQAEQVFLGLLRGSGTRSVAGIAPRRDVFLRPLLGLRRATTEAACAEWGVEVWDDPMNTDPAFARVRVRRWLAELEASAGRDVVPALGRTAMLARADADLLDQLAAEVTPAEGPLRVGEVAGLPEALRWRVLKGWLAAGGVGATMTHVFAVDQLVTAWRGQGPIDVPGRRVIRSGDELQLLG